MFTFALVSYMPLIVAGLAAYILGIFWYAHAAFGDPWKRMTGMTAAKAKHDASAAMAAGFVSSLVMAYVIALLMGILGTWMLSSAWALIVLLWVAFDFLPGMAQTLFARKPLMLQMINSGYTLVSALIIVTVLVRW